MDKKLQSNDIAKWNSEAAKVVMIGKFKDLDQYR